MDVSPRWTGYQGTINEVAAGFVDRGTFPASEGSLAGKGALGVGDGGLLLGWLDQGIPGRSASTLRRESRRSGHVTPRNGPSRPELRKPMKAAA